MTDQKILKNILNNTKNQININQENTIRNSFVSSF